MLAGNRLERWTKKIYGDSDAGQALVELSLTLPLMVLLLIGAAELTRVAYAAIEVSNAARAGAQYGAQSSYFKDDSGGISNAAAADAGDLTGLTTTPSLSYICSDGGTPVGAPLACTGSGAQVETILTVVTQVSIDPLIHLPGLGTTFTLTGRAQQKVLIQ
ncbi:MAG TPA: TadE/TadG family type IV pilus assembly protein [Terracidiphilus sp.]|nr:TadE/TadG family type IV pilus assembly protein [Terracidiphilus sp.]